VDLDAGTLFFACALGGGMNLSKAEGLASRFRWLPEVWQSYPDHQVIGLMDGIGSLPVHISDSCRARTLVLLSGFEK